MVEEPQHFVVKVNRCTTELDVVGESVVLKHVDGGDNSLEIFTILVVLMDPIIRTEVKDDFLIQILKAKFKDIDNRLRNFKWEEKPVNSELFSWIITEFLNFLQRFFKV